MRKCVIIDKHSDWNVVMTLEEAKYMYNNGRLEKIIQGIDEYFYGEVVSSNTPLGYVEDLESLNYENT